MSNFICPHCGMTNIDCGKDGYKTAKEIQLEQENHLLRLALKDKDIIKIVEENEKYSSELGVLRKKLEKIKKIADKTCVSGCRCIDKTDILQIIESEE